MNTSDLSSKTTHDLWVESRQFRIQISRPAPSTVELTIIRPVGHTTVDGAVILLHDKPITNPNYPSDGTQYVGSLDYSAPANTIEGADGARVLAFYSGILNQPMPAGTLNSSGTETSFSITITGTDDSVIYYASVHGCSNVLQYYPVGVLSYPLEGTNIEKGVAAFAGAIPSFAEAPTSPTIGTVYHDTQLNLIQYWTGDTWVSSRADSILTGAVNPGIQGQVYLMRASGLRVFSGTKWMIASPTNFQVRIPGPAWAPFTKVSANTALPTSPEVGQFAWDYTTERIQYWDGVQWVFPTPSNTLFDPGTGPLPAFTQPMSFEYDLLPDPYIGQLFYNTTLKVLNAWNGSTWAQANTDQEGSPISERIAVGTDGSYKDRLRLMQVLKNQLGWPVQCVELKEDQFNVAIDNALDNYRMWVDNAYTRQFIMFKLFPNQQLYFLNSQVQKTDRIVDVLKIHRLNVLGIETANGNDAIWSSGILTSYYSAATVDILSLHLLSNLSEEFQRIFAGDMTFVWDEPSRELLITRKVNRTEKVILEVSSEKTEQQIMTDRWSKQFIQNWALAECKEMLGMIRSKFSSGTPGAAGTITLNGELLVSEARQDMAELKQSALDYEWGGHVGWGNVSFLIG